MEFKTNKLGLRDNGQVYELNYIEDTVTPVKVEETIVQEDVKTKTSEGSEEIDARLPRHCRLIASSQNLIEIQTDFEPGTDFCLKPLVINVCTSKLFCRPTV